MTVYVTADELLDIEHARLELRRTHGLAVDRGRLVRAAIAMALADLDDPRRGQRARPAARRGMTVSAAVAVDAARRGDARAPQGSSCSSSTTSRVRSTCC